MHTRLFLIGLPGSGKSTFGKEVAQKMNYAFLDLDDKIIAYEQKTIAEIFSQKGEAYFRRLERKILEECLVLEKTVVATGGGTPCFYDNLKKIQQSGLVVYLNINPTHIAERLVLQPNERPLLETQDFDQLVWQLEAKLIERKKFYEKAHLILTESKISVEYLLNRLQ